MWAHETTFYQIYPIGCCGAPRTQDGVLSHRLAGLTGWIDHLKKLGVGAVLFNPLFLSGSHGYDQWDLRQVDPRLGTEEDLRALTGALHDAGIRVLFDAVFHHTGRGFFAFRDVQEKRWDSPYRDWFHISFDGDSNYGDGFWYEGWEGHFDLVKLNLYNGDVRQYLFDSVRFWIQAFDIDGLRLDVAYSLPHDFLRDLRGVVDAEKPDFFLAGETLFGDYNLIMNGGGLDSVTNYECYKGIHSSINSRNFFEISYSYNRQFGSEPWCLYRGRHLLSFVDNHDVTRIADQIADPDNLRIAYGLLFAMPGIPVLYYGSEWGMHGRKEEGDDALRPAVSSPEWNELTDFIAALSNARRDCPALLYGGYRNVQVTNFQLLFAREHESGRALAAFNLDGAAYTFHDGMLCGGFTNLLTGEHFEGDGSLTVPAHGVVLLRR